MDTKKIEFPESSGFQFLYVGKLSFNLNIIRWELFQNHV